MQNVSCGFFGDVLQQVVLFGELVWVGCYVFFDLCKEGFFFFGFGVFDQICFVGFDLCVEKNVQCCVVVIVQDYVGVFGEVEDFVGVVLIFFKGFIFDGKNWNVGCSDGGGSLILC